MSKDYQVICFGEILFDMLDAGPEPGGAPFNVAYHLKQALVESFLISSVGNDTPGEKLVEILKNWQLNTSGVNVSEMYPTGAAIVKHGIDNQPEYELVYPVAWDHIPYKEEYVKHIAQADAFVFGSLSSRNKRSYETLQKYLQYTSFNVFDVNIRPPHVDRGVLEKLLQKTHLLKINNIELSLISDWYGVNNREEREEVNAIRSKFNIDEVIVTKGEKGASYYSNGLELHEEAIAVSVADTVGSGDAFLAGFLSKRLQPNAIIQECLIEGIRKGGYVASQSGACPSYDRYPEYETNE